MSKTTVAPHCITTVVMFVLVVCRALVLVYPFAARSASTTGSISCWQVYWINCATVCLPRCRAASCDRHQRITGQRIKDTAGELPMGAILSEGRYPPYMEIRFLRGAWLWRPRLLVQD